MAHSDFGNVLKELLTEYCGPRGLDPSLVDYSGEHWAQPDVDAFMRSLDLFDFLGSGAFRWPRGHSSIALFGHGPKNAKPRPPTLSRETFAVMGSVAELHDRLGWPTDLIEVETAGYVFDFAAYGGVGPGVERMVIAGEAKSSQTTVEAWLVQLRNCIDLPPHEIDAHINKQAANAHKKRAGLEVQRPDYFWLVAPGWNLWFICTYAGSSIGLKSLGVEPPLTFAEFRSV